MTYEPVTLESLMAHQGWALRVARSLVHEEGEAEDLVQRTWLAALRRPPASERGVRSWIHTVILNLARERHRRRLVRERVERESLRPDRNAQDASEFVSDEELKHVLGERLLELAEPYRAVVMERFYEGRSSAEIARRLGIPSGTVRWRLKVGLDQLRSDLDRRCKGDRSRWVSALLAFLPTSGVPIPEDDLTEPSAVPTGASLAPTLGWLGLASLSLLGVVLVTLTTARGGSEEKPVFAAAARPEAPALTANEAHPRPREGLTALPSATPSAEPAAASGGFQVLVVDEDGEPVSGAQILVARSSGLEPRGSTDEQGRTWLQVHADDPGALGLPSTRGRVSVRAEAEGRAASPLFHVEPPFTAEHEVLLVLGRDEKWLEGQVIDPQGRPVHDALLAWFDPKGELEVRPEGDFPSPSYLSTRTDQAGRFRLGGLPKNGGILGCFAAGFTIHSQALDNSPGRAPVLVRLDPGASITGLVRWPGGLPAADIEVAFEPCVRAAEWATGLPGYDVSMRGFAERTRTDENGRYRLEGVNSSRPRMLWARDSESGLVASLALRLESGSEERWDPELGKPSGFRLRLVDEERQALVGWFVHVRRPLEGENWWIRRLATDAEGRLWIPDCPTGEALIDVFDPTDVGGSFAWTRLAPSEEERVIEVTTRASSSCSGQVVDSLGMPELRGKLELHSLITTLATPIERDERGCFEQRTVPGAYALVLRLDQTAVQLAALRVRPNEVHPLGTLATPPMGSLRLNGSALLAGGDRSPGYSIFLLSDDEKKRGSIRLGGGKLSEDMLLTAFPGRYRILAADARGAQHHAFEVRVQPYVETRLALKP